jgi:hypothetical protein
MIDLKRHLSRRLLLQAAFFTASLVPESKGCICHDQRASTISNSLQWRYLLQRMANTALGLRPNHNMKPAIWRRNVARRLIIFNR